MPRVGIALGSNLGDRLANIRAAVADLKEISVAGATFLEASIYQTEPVHCPPGSPVFYNTVVELAFNGTPSGLLEITRAFEKRLGRIAAPVRNAPRVIDIDLLYFGDEIIATEDLILPHPRLHERRFVLEPLAEIRGDLVLPGMEKTIGDTLAQLVSDEPPLARVPA